MEAFYFLLSLEIVHSKLNFYEMMMLFITCLFIAFVQNNNNRKTLWLAS